MKTAREYQTEINAWSEHNFAYHDEFGYGMLEEVGELAHAELKFKQCIRGHDQPESRHDKRKASVLDALSDIMIFLLDFTGRKGITMSFDPVESKGAIYCKSQSVALGGMAKSCGYIIEYTTRYLQSLQEEQPSEGELAERAMLRSMIQKYSYSLLGWVWHYFRFYGVTPRVQLAETWKEVRKRDWIKFPRNGTDK